MKSKCTHCGTKVSKGGVCRSCGPVEKALPPGNIPDRIPPQAFVPRVNAKSKLPSVSVPRPFSSGIARGSGRAMLGKVAKAASDVGAKAPSISSYKRGSYKVGKTQADGFGRKAIGHISPKKTETFDTVPSQGFKGVSVSSLEVGGYKRK